MTRGDEPECCALNFDVHCSYLELTNNQLSGALPGGITTVYTRGYLGLCGNKFSAQPSSCAGISASPPPSPSRSAGPVSQSSSSSISPSNFATPTPSRTRSQSPTPSQSPGVAFNNQATASTAPHRATSSSTVIGATIGVIGGVVLVLIVVAAGVKLLRLRQSRLRHPKMAQVVPAPPKGTAGPREVRFHHDAEIV